MSIENCCRFVGNLGADPEARFTQDGTCVVNFRMGVTKKFKDKDGQKQEQTEWPRFVAWGKKAETINQYASKGTGMIVEGEYQQRKWQNQAGEDQYSVEFVVQNFKFLGGGSNRAANNESQDSSFPSHGGRQPADNEKGGNNDPFASTPDFGDVPVDDDIPF